MKLEQLNYPKESDSKYLRGCLEKNYEKVVGHPLYVQMRYFKSGMDALNWKAAIMLGERGVKDMTTMRVESNELLAMLEWVCRWADGTITVLIVEENLKRWAQGDKEAIEGLSLHVLGHISDMDRRDFFTSYDEWAGEVGTEEELRIFRRARDIAIEYEAERIAIERGGFSLVEKCRGKTSCNFEWLRKDLKLFKKELAQTKRTELPTRKEYIIGTSLIFLAYKMAWKKTGHGEAYDDIFDVSQRQVKELYSEFGIAEKVAFVEAQAEKYVEELEDVFDNTDLSDIRAVRGALCEYISRTT